MINNIKNNTISEADAKQKLNALDKIRRVETKNKRLISSQKILLNLFDDLLETIFNNNNNNNNNKNMNEDNNVSMNESGNVSVHKMTMIIKMIVRVIVIMIMTMMMMIMMNSTTK